MTLSQIPRVALGRYDPFRRTPSVELQNGKIKFLPGRWAKYQFESTEAAFPLGSRLEYRIQKGDMYFAGDHGQALGRTLWAIEPDGSRRLLASGFILYLDFTVAARNLQRLGVPFRAVTFYEGPNGEQIETELSTSSSRLRIPMAFVLGSSNLWLGALAGLFIHRVSYLIAIGMIAFLVLAVATVRSASSTRTALLKIFSSLPIYGAGYAVAVVLVRFFATGLAGK
jgi:hypothetical protein